MTEESQTRALSRIQKSLRHALRSVWVDRGDGRRSVVAELPAGGSDQVQWPQAAQLGIDPTAFNAEAPSTSVEMAMREMAWDIGLPGLPLHGRLWQRDRATTLLVMMPSAVDRTSPYRHPSFARWQWATSFPDVHFVALADPAMGMHSWLQGAWYMHPEIDVIGAMAHSLKGLTSELGAERILVYGSSLGGFGALALAAMLDNASAIAEVPQLDFAHWGPEARLDLEDYVIGCDLDDHRERHPEQVSIRARFELAQRIPPYSIITNVQEQGFKEQVEFQKWVSSLAGGPTRIGRHELRITDEFLGHRALDTSVATALIHEELART